MKVDRVSAPLAVFRVRRATRGQLQALTLEGRIAFVERDRQRVATSEQFEVLDPLTGIPFTMWFDPVRAGEALALVPGAPFSVAVIDSGAEVTHPDLAGKLVAPFDAGIGGSDVQDFVGHGTFVAGLIAAATNGVGIRDVAGTTPVMPIRATIDGTFDSSIIANAIVHAVARTRA